MSETFFGGLDEVAPCAGIVVELPGDGLVTALGVGVDAPGVAPMRVFGLPPQAARANASRTDRAAA